jgi:hypothetical protein
MANSKKEIPTTVKGTKAIVGKNQKKSGCQAAVEAFSPS